MSTKILTIDGIDRFVAGRFFPKEYPTEAHFEGARQWLHRCLQHHSTCKRDESSPAELPMRVINVTKEGWEACTMCHTESLLRKVGDSKE
jgi:hypothetical protein